MDRMYLLPSFIYYLCGQSYLRVPTLIILKPVLDISFICTYPVYNFKRELFSMHVCIYIKKTHQHVKQLCLFESGYSKVQID